MQVGGLKELEEGEESLDKNESSAIYQSEKSYCRNGVSVHLPSEES